MSMLSWPASGADETVEFEVTDDSSLADLIRYAEQHSPDLRAATHLSQAAEERIQQARGLPDPRLQVAVAAVPIETRVGPQQGKISFDQTIPGRGKRGQRERVARADVVAAQSEYELRRRELGFRVADAYYDLYMLARSIEITRDNRDILIYVEQVVRKAYETGNAPYADLIRSQVEIGKLENDLRSLSDQRRAATAHLNTLLHRDVEAPLPSPAVTDAPVRLRPAEEMREAVVKQAPEANVLERRLEGESQRVKLAQIEDRLDWNLSLSYVPIGAAAIPNLPDSGRDAVLAGVSIRLPVWGKKYRAAEREALEREAAIVEARSEIEDRLSDRLERLLYRFENADREIRLYRDTLIPKSEQSLEASQTGLRTGSVSVLDLVDTTRVMLQFQLAYERAVTERARATAELRYLFGEDVSTLQETGRQGSAS
jgi:outer membrane protein TolC